MPAPVIHNEAIVIDPYTPYDYSGKSATVNKYGVYYFNISATGMDTASVSSVPLSGRYKIANQAFNNYTNSLSGLPDDNVGVDPSTGLAFILLKTKNNTSGLDTSNGALLTLYAKNNSGETTKSLAVFTDARILTDGSYLSRENGYLSNVITYTDIPDTTIRRTSIIHPNNQETGISLLSTTNVFTQLSSLTIYKEDPIDLWQQSFIGTGNLLIDVKPLIKKFDPPVSFGRTGQKMYWGIVHTESQEANRTNAAWGELEARTFSNLYVAVNPTSSEFVPYTGWLKPTGSQGFENVNQYSKQNPQADPTLQKAFYPNRVHTLVYGVSGAPRRYVFLTKIRKIAIGEFEFQPPTASVNESGSYFDSAPGVLGYPNNVVLRVPVLLGPLSSKNIPLSAYSTTYSRNLSAFLNYDIPTNGLPSIRDQDESGLRGLRTYIQNTNTIHSIYEPFSAHRALVSLLSSAPGMHQTLTLESTEDDNYYTVTSTTSIPAGLSVPNIASGTGWNYYLGNNYYNWINSFTSVTSSVSSGGSDPDSDQRSNRDEFIFGTNPIEHDGIRYTAPGPSGFLLNASGFVPQPTLETSNLSISSTYTLVLTSGNEYVNLYTDLPVLNYATKRAFTYNNKERLVNYENYYNNVFNSNLSSLNTYLSSEGYTGYTFEEPPLSSFTDEQLKDDLDRIKERALVFEKLSSIGLELCLVVRFNRTGEYFVSDLPPVPYINEVVFHRGVVVQTGLNEQTIQWHPSAYPRIVGNRNGIGVFGPISARAYWGVKEDQNYYSMVHTSKGSGTYIPSGAINPYTEEPYTEEERLDEMVYLSYDYFNIPEQGWAVNLGQDYYITSSRAYIASIERPFYDINYLRSTGEFLTTLKSDYSSGYYPNRIFSFGQPLTSVTTLLSAFREPLGAGINLNYFAFLPTNQYAKLSSVPCLYRPDPLVANTEILEEMPATSPSRTYYFAIKSLKGKDPNTGEVVYSEAYIIPGPINNINLSNYDDYIIYANRFTLNYVRENIDMLSYGSELGFGEDELARLAYLGYI